MFRGVRHRAAARLAAFLVAALAAVSTTHTVRADGDERFLRGVVVSCPRAGQIWGSPQMAESLEEIAALGADWIAIHPYAGVRRDGTIRLWPASEAAYLTQAAEIARDADVRLFWKPHLAYWGSFAWRGDIDFGDDWGAWRRFFDGYRRFIVDQATFAQRMGVELFAVGVEYEKTTRFECEWRRIIAAVREVFRGRITYAANWDSLDRVPFWDAVDLIGVHAYFPLATAGTRDREALWRGWDAPLAELESLSRSYDDKPILFAEIGYARSTSAASEPWLPDHRNTPEVRSFRRHLIEVALERIEASSFVRGMFWWKWVPGEDRWDRDFSMRDTEAREALLQHWGNPGPTPVTAR